MLLYVLSLPVLPLMEPHETRYALIPQYMNNTGDYVTPHLKEVAYLEKPPLAYWATALFFRICGENAFAARLAAGLSAWGCLLLVYSLGCFFHDRKTGLYSAAVLSVSLLPFALGRINILDMPLTFFVCLAIWCGFRFFISTGGAIYVVIPHRLTYAGSGGGPMTLPETLETYLKSLFYYLTSPNLLSNLSLTKIAAAPQMIVWLGLLVFCFLPGVMYLLRFRLRLSGILIIYLFIFTSAMALYTGNEGAAFRQRDALTPIFFIPMSIGFFNFTGWLSRHIKAATQKRMDGIKSGNTPAGIKNSPEIY